MIIKRFFKDSDAEEVANLVKETMLTTNIKDYSNKYLENDLEAVAIIPLRVTLEIIKVLFP